MHCNDKLR
jgi:hypothetical protein